MKALNEKVKPLGPVFGPDQSGLQCWLCQAIDWGQQWDGATIVRVDGMKADFYTETPQEMKRILTTRGYPVKRMLILEK